MLLTYGLNIVFLDLRESNAETSIARSKNIKIKLNI